MLVSETNGDLKFHADNCNHHQDDAIALTLEPGSSSRVDIALSKDGKSAFPQFPFKKCCLS